MDRQQAEPGKPVPRCDGCKFKAFAKKYREAATENLKLKKRLRRVLASVKNFKADKLRQWGEAFESISDRAKEGMIEKSDIPIADVKYRLVMIQDAIHDAKMTKTNRFSRVGMLTPSEMQKFFRLVREELGEDYVDRSGRRETVRNKRAVRGAGKKNKKSGNGGVGGEDSDKKNAGKSPSDDFGRKSRRLPDLDLPESMDVGSDIPEEELEAVRREELRQEGKKAMEEYFDDSGEGFQGVIEEGGSDGERQDEDREVGEDEESL